MVTGLGYIGIESRRPDDWVQFGVDVLGLQQGTNCADGVISLRMDDRAARIMVQPGSREGLAFLGWEVAGARQLETLFDRLLAHGCVPVYASEDECAERQVQALIRCVDPTGIPLEFFCGQLCVKERFQPSRAISGFRTGALGMGHLVLQVPDIDVAMGFYVNVLDFRLSDQLAKVLYFLRCNARHHSIGLASIGGEPRLLHIMVEVESLEDVGCTLDVCLDRGLQVTTLGLHSNDRMTSFYVKSPSGFEVEYGWNGLLVDEDTWATTTIDRPSVCGHRQVDMTHPPDRRPLQRLSAKPRV